MRVDLVGCGYIDGRNTETKELQATKQAYTNYKRCQNFGINSGNCFLTQDIVGNSQACPGGSGGPLYCDFGNGNKSFGIVSFVSATICDKGYTGFTLLMIYKSFIDYTDDNYLYKNGYFSMKFHLIVVFIFILTLL